jgi:quinol monooxygenase YgiN
MIVVTSKLKSVPGSRAKVAELSRAAVEATRKENGCVRYELFASTEDDVTLQFIEEWTDIDSLKAHLKSPHLAAFKEARKDFVQDGAVLKLFDAKETSLN